MLGKDTRDFMLKKQREKEIQERQSSYRWGDNPRYCVDAPGFLKAEGVDSLPKDVQFLEEEENTLALAGYKGAANLALGDLYGVFQSWDDLDDFRKCFTPLVGDVPPAGDHWRDDVWYGSQFLRGCNPDHIKRCTELPSNFPVTDAILVDLLDSGVSLEQAIRVSQIKMHYFSAVQLGTSMSSALYFFGEPKYIFTRRVKINAVLHAV